MDLKPYITLLWRWAWLVVLCAILAGTLAFGVSRQQDPVYAASTTLLVNQARPSNSAPTMEDLLLSQQLVKTYVELLRKRPVLEGVIANLKLNTDPASLAKQIQVTTVRDTLLILVTVEDSSPQRAVDIANEAVNVLNQQEADLLANRYAASRPSLHVVEPAHPNPIPVRPNILRNTLLATVVGALLALGLALLVEYLDTSVRSSEDVEQLTGLATLAAIARIRGTNLPDKLVTVRDPHAPIAEAYRMVRAHLEVAAADKPIRTIAVTSGSPLEGKSTTVANIAVALAQTGMRVILVDTDLRHPTLHEFFEKPNTRGFTTAMQQQGRKAANDYLVPSGIENLHLLLSGPLPPNPTRLLVPQRMARLIEELEADADIVLFDSPPLLAVVDTTLLVRACDATVLVVLAASTRAEALRKSYHQLAQSRTHLLGVVLNRVSNSLSRYSGYSYYRGAQRQDQGLHQLYNLGLLFLRGTGNRSHSSAEALELSDEIRSLGKRRSKPPQAQVPGKEKAESIERDRGSV